ncbi:hypothetical protein BKI52_06700 [marine bacterium AO1-C]|nr:hypothetical protein BKI52_06700 [marine bacterium AO1-C]
MSSKIKKTMKKLLIIIMLGMAISMNAQAQENQTSKTQADQEAAIKAVVLQYIENFFENKYEPMAAVLHPRLAKRGLQYKRSGKRRLSNDYPLAGLKKLMTIKKPLPKKHQKNEVKILDVFRNQASVRLVTGYPKMRWVEYMHLANIDGKWVVMNVFWDYFPRKKRAKQD